MGSILGLGGSATAGYRYFMAVMMGIGRGAVDAVVEIRVGDKMAWPVVDGAPILDGPNPAPGMPTITDSTVATINAPELFGGDKGEGGILGPLHVMMGKPDQVVSPAIKAALGGPVPEFRGVTTLYFDGLICSLNPYPKPWKFRIRRITSSWDGPVWHPELATIVYNNGAILAMNPAHILYEVATNRDWGRGFPRSRLDEASFLRAAQKLYDEKFGMCLRYNRQDGLDEFVSTIIDHIGAVVYTSRETGLLTLDLIRDDYDIDDVPLFDYDSGLISVNSPEITGREDRVNEVIVKYKDPIKNEERSCRAHNLASIQTLGVKNSSTVEYPGVPHPELAARLASRDLRAAARSGSRFTVKLRREGWRIVPGKVFRISAPDKGIADLVLRAGKVEDPNILDGEITVTAVPDIFGLPNTAYTTVQDSYWVSPDRSTQSPVFTKVREATYRDIVRNVSRADLQQLMPEDAYVVAMAAKPTNMSLSFNMSTKTSAESDFVSRDEDSFAPTFITKLDISPKTVTVPFAIAFDASAITFPCAGQIGDEIVRVEAVSFVDSGGIVTITRGCVDTIPQAHTAGSALILYDGFLGIDGREYARGEIVNVKITTNTSSESQNVNDVNARTVTIQGRQGRPYTAGNVSINNVSLFDSYPASQDTAIRWSHRNKFLLQDQLLGFFEASSDKEPGVLYRIRFYDGDKTYRLVEGISGNEYIYTKDQADSDGVVVGRDFFAELETYRGDVTALNKYVIPLRRT